MHLGLKQARHPLGSEGTEFMVSIGVRPSIPSSGEHGRKNAPGKWR
jgi:hypothetical protein